MGFSFLRTSNSFAKLSPGDVYPLSVTLPLLNCPLLAENKPPLSYYLSGLHGGLIIVVMLDIGLVTCDTSNGETLSLPFPERLVLLPSFFWKNFLRLENWLDF